MPHDFEGLESCLWSRRGGHARSTPLDMKFLGVALWGSGDGVATHFLVFWFSPLAPRTSISSWLGGVPEAPRFRRPRELFME